MVEEMDDYELVISKQQENPAWDYNTVFHYGWSTKNDETDTWEHEFQDTYCNRYSGNEIVEKLICCDKYVILSTTKTIFAYQGDVQW